MNAIEGSVALVTGGSRGIGRALVAALYEGGAKKVSAAARDPRTVTHPDAVPLALEVTDPASVRGGRRACPGRRRPLTAGQGGAGGGPGRPLPAGLRRLTTSTAHRHTGNSRATNALSCRAVRHSCISTSSA